MSQIQGKGSTEKAEVQQLEETTPALSEFDEKRLMRKIDLHVVPILTLLYLLSFIDRANIVSIFRDKASSA
jgi:hypothetical protein